MDRFGKLGFSKKQIEEGLDEQNAEALENLKNLGSSFKKRTGLGVDIPQTPTEIIKPELKPRSALVGKPTDAGIGLQQTLSNVDAANKLQQMKDLEEAQNAAEFGDEEALAKVARLKALLDR